MTPHEWKTLASFGLLVGALGLFDVELAMGAVAVAAFVVVIRNADKLEDLLK